MSNVPPPSTGPSQDGVSPTLPSSSPPPSIGGGGQISPGLQMFAKMFPSATAQELQKMMGNVLQQLMSQTQTDLQQAQEASSHMQNVIEGTDDGSS